MSEKTIWDNWPERIVDGVASGRMSREKALEQIKRLCAFAATKATEYQAEPPEVRLDDDGVDEVVANCASVHLERMDNNAWHLIVSAGGKTVHCPIAAKRATVTATHWVERDIPPPPRPDPTP